MRSNQRAAGYSWLLLGRGRKRSETVDEIIERWHRPGIKLRSRPLDSLKKAKINKKLQAASFKLDNRSGIV